MPKGWVAQGGAELMAVVVMTTRNDTPNALTYWLSTPVIGYTFFTIFRKEKDPMVTFEPIHEIIRCIWCGSHSTYRIYPITNGNGRWYKCNSCGQTFDP